MRKALNLDASYVEDIWPEHLFSLTLDQSLVVAMEHEARWSPAWLYRYPGIKEYDLGVILILLHLVPHDRMRNRRIRLIFTVRAFCL